MVFYEVNGKIITSEIGAAATGKGDGAISDAQESGLFDKHGKVERDQLPFIQTAVSHMAVKTEMQKMRIDVVDLRRDRFCFIVLTNFDALKKYPIKNTVLELLDELGLSGKMTGQQEITESTYSTKLSSSERHDFCPEGYKIREEFDIYGHARDFKFTERKLTEIDFGTPKSKPVSQNLIKAYAESLACENLLEEITRVSANKKYGTPVHYRISMEKMDACRDVYDFLLDCLKRNGRILRGVVNIWSNTYEERRDRFSKANIQKIYDRSECGVVVIKSNYEEFSGDAAPAYYRQIREICEVIRANKRNVLTILCFEKSAKKQQKAFMDNLENMTFVDIREAVMYKPEAIKYLRLLAKRDEYSIVEEAIKKLQDGKGYTRLELSQMYIDVYAEYQKAVEFPEYKDFAVIEKRIEEKIEGIAYAQLQSMIGLRSVKEQIENIISFAKVQKLAIDKGLTSASITKHMVFTGSPGTAKTTVARLFAQIMKDNSLLASGVFVEVGRAELVGEYLGHTAPKVRAQFKKAQGGVLFIDEAYALLDGRTGFYGDEAINTIVQEMENNRDSTIVIFAGYKKEMDCFIDRNSGLKSRVAHYVDFPDYEPSELLAILELMAKEQNLTIDGARAPLLEIMKTVVKSHNFGNGRFARNLLDKARLKQAERITKMESPQAEDILTLLSADFSLPQEYRNQKPSGMGFGNE